MKIEGYFGNIKTANEAVSKIKSLGLNNAVVDINDHYVDDRNVVTNLPGTETSVSNSGLVLESDDITFNMAKAPLEGASPMVSGIGNFEEIADVKCKVIVEADDGSAERVEKIIKSMGGELDNPNIDKPKMRNERDIMLYNVLDEIRRNT
ncbi:MAG: hypothetical protein ACOYWZ_07975 [Bacillota bacterium]